MQNTGPQKTYVVNPATNRPILYGGTTYRKLLRENMIKHTTNEPIPEHRRVKTSNNIVARTNNRNTALQIKNKMTKEQPLEQQYYAVGCDGRSVVKKHKRLPSMRSDRMTGTMVSATARVNQRVMSDPVLSDMLQKDPNNPYLAKKIEDMLKQEMITNNNNNNIINKNNNAPTSKKQISANGFSKTNATTSRRRGKVPIFANSDCETVYTTDYNTSNNNGESQNESDDADEYDDEDE